MSRGARRAIYALCCVAMLEGQDCWYAEDVVVLNRTSEPITVTIEARRGYPADSFCHCPDGFIHPKLAMTAAATEGEVAGPWRSVDSAVLQRDSSASLGPQLFVQLTLPPRTALRLGRVRVAGNRIDGAPPFWTLQLAGAGRTERCDGGMIGQSFKRVGRRHVYAFTGAPRN